MTPRGWCRPARGCAPPRSAGRGPPRRRGRPSARPSPSSVSQSSSSSSSCRASGRSGRPWSWWRRCGRRPPGCGGPGRARAWPRWTAPGPRRRRARRSRGAAWPAVRAPGSGRSGGRGRPRRGRARWRKVRRARSRKPSISPTPLVEAGARVGQGRAGQQRLELVQLAVDQAADRPSGRARAPAAPAGPPRPTSRRRRARRAWRRRSASRRGRRRPGRGWGSRARARSRETTGVVQACTARIRASSENGSRSSTEPPPRATTITSTAVVAVERTGPPRSPRGRRACPASRRTSP